MPLTVGPLADLLAEEAGNPIAYSLALDLLISSVMGLPVAGRDVTIAFTRNPVARDIRFTVQISDILGAWEDGSFYESSGDMPATSATTDITPAGFPPGFVFVRDIPTESPPALFVSR